MGSLLTSHRVQLEKWICFQDVNRKVEEYLISDYVQWLIVIDFYFIYHDIFRVFISHLLINKKGKC